MQDSYTPNPVGMAELRTSRQTRVACKTDMKQVRTPASHLGPFPDYLMAVEEAEVEL